MECYYCGTNFKNKIALATHVSKTHKKSPREYVVDSEYNGEEPKCKCGCGSPPLFSRGKFSKFANKHNTFANRKKRYIEQNGIPRCKCCKKELTFGARANIKKCECQLTGGFRNPEIRRKIRDNLLKQGYTSNSQKPEVRRKLSENQKNQKNTFFGKTHSKEKRKKGAEQSAERWKNKEFKKNTSKRIKDAINSNPIELQRRREWARDQWNLSGRLSKLHIAIKENLKLEQLGFISEVPLCGFSVDEFNQSKKIIIEINGDYIHANPKKYNADDIIIVKGSRYKAKDKWEKDSDRISMLENAGYKVIIIWESDNLQEKMKEIYNALHN